MGNKDINSGAHFAVIKMSVTKMNSGKRFFWKQYVPASLGLSVASLSKNQEAGLHQLTLGAMELV
jgi:hypothetical protein